MSFETLKPEIWDHVLTFLAPTLPKPLSGLTQGQCVWENEVARAVLPKDGAPGIVGRKDIRATELAVLMRTSIVSRAFGYISFSGTYGSCDLGIQSARFTPPI
jgi:hypothetical protein